MIVIIAGSRGLGDLDQVMDVIDQSPFSITGVILGGAAGVDTAASMKPWACPVETMRASWRTFGVRAGYVRNVRMSLAGEALIAIWDGNSRGTKHMIETMRKAGKPVYLACRSRR